MIKKISTSLLITAIVALCVAGLLNYIIGYDFYRGLTIAFVGQLVLFYVWNTVLQAFMRVQFEKEKTKQAEYFSRQGIECTCAHCNTVNYIPIFMDQTNDFACENCGKPNSVYIDITVAQQTDITDKQSLSVNKFIKEKLDATTKLQEK
tara:strand:+ start:309 stop:755 length:447 start_codon:yes stop_codon:yes gene_type:complete